MAKLEGKVLVAQGGGPTAVINQSMVGVVIEARKFPQVTRVYGAVHGVPGIVNEEFMDLTQETTHNLEQVASTPSSALLSTRDKPDEEYCARIFKVLKAHDVRYFFYIGGNDSSDTARIVNQNAEQAGYDLRCVHIPKTIDNDLVVNDHTPGLSLGGALRGAGLHGRQPGQPRPARRLHRRRHGAPRRLPHRGQLAGPHLRRRRPAPDLPARAALRRRAVPRRRGPGLQAARPLRGRGERGDRRRRGRRRS